MSDADLDLSTVPDYSIGEYTLTLEVSDGDVTVSDSMVLAIALNPCPDISFLSYPINLNAALIVSVHIWVGLPLWCGKTYWLGLSIA